MLWSAQVKIISGCKSERPYTDFEYITIYYVSTEPTQLSFTIQMNGLILFGV